MSEMDRARLIDAEWQGEESIGGERYAAEINIYTENRTGLLVDISSVFTERKIDIKSINTRVSKQGRVTMSVSFEVRNKEELNELVKKVQNIPNVIDVQRTRG